MFGSQMLEIAIGLSFVYLSLATICSVIRERTEAIFRTRSVDLERGIRELLGNDAALTKQIYDHGMINGLFKGPYNADAIKKNGLMPRLGDLPSYIPNSNFAVALLDVTLKGLNTNALTLPQLQSAVSKIENPAVRDVLSAAVVTTQGDLTQMRQVVEQWFDSSMDRVSGWYRARSQKFILVLSLLVTVAINANTLTILQRLATTPSLQKALVTVAENSKIAPPPMSASSTSGTRSTSTPSAASATKKDGAALTGSSTTPDATNAQAGGSPAQGHQQPGADTGLKDDSNKVTGAWKTLSELGLPLGWSQGWPGQTASGLNEDRPTEGFAWTWFFVLQPMFGLLLTAFAISLGAPVWFDLMNKLISLRASLKPVSDDSPTSQSLVAQATVAPAKSALATAVVPRS